jgi:YVTN family beta-propeller protein
MSLGLPTYLRLLRLFAAILLLPLALSAQVTTAGFLNLPRPEAPGTLLSHPLTNDSEPIGRTTSINYLNGWIIVGGEAPGSRPGSDLVLRVYDISNPVEPLRRHPSDFGLNYSPAYWHQGNVGWAAHGTAQSGDLLLPNVLRVPSFGGPVLLGGQHGIPHLGQVPVGYERGSQAGPWHATVLWYGRPDSPFTIEQAYLSPAGYTQFRTLATFDHVGPFGGGDWHPMFFGDLLIYARSGPAGRDGVVVYRLAYHADPATDALASITPQFVGSLPGGFQAYWPVLFSDGPGLYVIGSATNILMAADITDVAHPAGDGEVRLVANLPVPGLSNAPYPVFQDNFGFIHNRKVDMGRLVAGDPSPIVLTLDEAAPPFSPSATPLGENVRPGIDTSQMSLALGNLWLTGGYPHNLGTVNHRSQGMAVWVHQQAPDTTRPRVTYHIPQAGRANYPRHAPLSFLIPEHPRRGGPRPGLDFLVRPVIPGAGGAPDTHGPSVSGFAIHDFSGVFTFTPSSPLAADTTYQVDFLADDNGTPADLDDDLGFQDAAGNLIEPLSFRFSTGGGLSAVPPPAFTSFTADLYQPAPGQSFTVTAAATSHADPAALDYRFNFDGTWSDWSDTSSASHSYAASGRPRVLAQVRDSLGQVAHASLRLLVITPPLAPGAPRPTQSASLAVGDDPAGRRVWVVNPDSDTVAVLDAATGAKLAEHSTGPGSSPRSIARDALGRYWVACHSTDQLLVLDPATGAPLHNLLLPYGSAPFGIAPSSDGQHLYVTLHGSARLQRYSASAPAAAPLSADTFPTPRALAVSADGARVLVTRFLSPELEGQIAEFHGATLAPVRTFRLASSNVTDGGDRAAGVPNHLTAIALSPDGTRAAVASKQDNIQRGQLFGVGDLTHETTVRAVVSFLNLVSNAEIPHSRRDIDNSADPSALAYTPLGDTLLVALQGSNSVVGIDALNLAPLPIDVTAGSTETSPATLAFELGAGLAPQGLLLDPVTHRLFTQNFLGRSVTVHDAAPLLLENRSSLPPLPASPVSTVATELLSPEVLLGKRIFYNAADPRMSADGYISCATCHLDGGHDGRTWDFTGRGEGLRRTTDLRGRSGLGHGRVHWSGNFDEIQDFEHDIRGPFGGTGFLPLNPQQFAALHPSPASGKTGLSPELDALAAYVASLGPSTVPRSPHRAPDGTLPAAALRGRDVFHAQSCTDCHSTAGGRLTDSALGPVSTPNLHDVGTLSALSGLRLGQPLLGIDTPTLHGLHAARSYLHHGLARTLGHVFSHAGGTLRLAADAGLVGLASSAIALDSPAQGGGGYYRGAYGGSSVALTGAPANAVRFTGIDGGAAGGTARLALRYVKQWGLTATAHLVVNGGAPQPLTLTVQEPVNGWQISGWRWLDTAQGADDPPLLIQLQPGPTNTLELRRGNDDWHLNAILLANADDLAAAHPHRRVLALSTDDRADLLAYLRTLDGRDDSGAPLAAPAQPSASAPAIVHPPAPRTVALGNPVSFHVVVAGTGPFAYEWRRGTTPVGGNSPILEIPAATLADAGPYNVRITNIAGEITSSSALLTVNPVLSVATATLPRGTHGRPYAFALAAAGGVGPRTWTLHSGVLPPGLALTADGTLSGTPTHPARAEFTVRVTDESGQATRALALDVRPLGGFSADPDLVLHYTFDEGAGTRAWDISPAGNNHTTQLPAAASTQWVADGRFGGAYGSSNLAGPLVSFFPANQGDLNFDGRSESFTISVWVRSTSTDGYATLLGKNSAPGDNERWQLRFWIAANPNTVQGIVANGGAGMNIPSLKNGQWHLLTLVNFPQGDGYRTRLYFNGGSVFAEANVGAATPVANLLRVGDTSHGGNPWLGQIDDLRIYRRALTPDEIDALYAPPAAPLNYDTWMAGLANPPAPEHRAPTAIPPGGALPNLLAYALGLDPGSAGFQPVPSPTASFPQSLSLTFTRLRADLDYTVEASSTLAPDSWNVITTNPVPVGEEATVLDPVPLTPESPRRFLRLRVEER